MRGEGRGGGEGNGYLKSKYIHVEPEFLLLGLYLTNTVTYLGNGTYARLLIEGLSALAQDKNIRILKAH